MNDNPPKTALAPARLIYTMVLRFIPYGWMCPDSGMMLPDLMSLPMIQNLAIAFLLAILNASRIVGDVAK